MIKFVPVQSDKSGDASCTDSSVFGYVGYDLSNEGRECGKCSFRLNGYTMDIISVEVYDSDAETAEGLIRSALNYGANRLAYIAYYKTESFVPTAELLGFQKDKNGVLSGDIPTLLQGSCCEGK